MTTTTFPGHDDPPASAPYRCLSVARWVAEWNAWKNSPAAAAAVIRWRTRSELIAADATVDAVLNGCGHDRRVADTVANDRLLFLVREATAGDRDAARVVLARMLPGLLAFAARRAGPMGRPFGDLFEDYLAAAWIATIDYPVDRRPAKVAANLLWNTEGLLHGRRPVIERRTVPRPPHQLPLPDARRDGRPVDTADDPLATLIGLLSGGRRAGLSPDSLATLTDLGVRGLTPATVAARDRISDRAVRLRRARAVRELRTRLDLPAPRPRRRPRVSTLPAPVAVAQEAAA